MSNIDDINGELRAALDAALTAHERVAAAQQDFKQAMREMTRVATKAACDFPDEDDLQDIAAMTQNESYHLKWCRLPAAPSDDLCAAIRGDDDDDEGDDDGAPVFGGPSGEPIPACDGLRQA
jgi:hypothetical protein